MPNVGNQPQSGERALSLPALPPPGSQMPQIILITTGGLQSIYDQVVDGTIIPDIGRRNMRRYLSSVFTNFNLFRAHDLDNSLRTWFESIDDFERRTRQAEQEGQQRNPEPRGSQPLLPGIEAILAGTAHIAPNQLAGGAAAQGPSGRYGVNPLAADERRDRDLVEEGGMKRKTLEERLEPPQLGELEQIPPMKKRMRIGEDGGTVPQRKPSSIWPSAIGLPMQAIRETLLSAPTPAYQPED
ncbi:hypothetical protein BT96DRAFT_1002102 [Gymnopus androsaceus JB14]|uniref:Uncharacterized protein n=1 Tax=Gymnopus androsaceus JB14 TaxID=1447944 RepID=A0A6A4GZY2_9AGAR|nr:hypothetical protein BT96DRAFT_1002102 [Gymnopus androsaceus JB14]